MTLALNALQKAVYERLTDELDVPVYNHVPQSSGFPYVVIGEKYSDPWRTKEADGQAVTVVLHVWSNRAGDKECTELIEAVYAALHLREFAVPGFSLAEIACVNVQLLPDTGDEAQPDHYYHGIMRFLALIHN